MARVIMDVSIVGPSFLSVKAVCDDISFWPRKETLLKFCLFVKDQVEITS